MDDEAVDAIAQRLAGGEQLVWAGRPHRLVYAYDNGGGMDCFALYCLVGLALQLGSLPLFLVSLLLLIASAHGVLSGRTVCSLVLRKTEGRSWGRDAVPAPAVR